MSHVSECRHIGFLLEPSPLPRESRARAYTALVSRFSSTVKTSSRVVHYSNEINSRQHIDLARAKSEALDDIYSLLKLNIKSCNAKR